MGAAETAVETIRRCTNSCGRDPTIRLSFFGQRHWGLYKFLGPGTDDTIGLFRPEVLGLYNFLGAGSDDIVFFGKSYRGPYKTLWAGSDDTIVVFRADLLGTVQNSLGGIRRYDRLFRA